MSKTKLPNLSKNERVVLSEFIELPEFHKNVTSFFKNEIVRYIKQKRVFRISIMGETRSGKSEVGSTICFWYSNIFNRINKIKELKKHDVFNDGSGFKPQKIKFNPKFVCSNQQQYISTMKDMYKDKTLPWGQIWQIDEEKSSTGGVGSMTEMMELTNLNNIIAKFNQAEVWIQPLKLETRNAPYGLQVIHNDYKKKENWALLFKIKQTPEGMSEFKLLGWCCIPLHSNEQFRKEYNLKKNQWIGKEIEGGGDGRYNQRRKVAEYIIQEHPKIFEKSDSGKSYKYSKKQQTILIQRLINKGEINVNLNALELEYVLEECKMIIIEGEI